MFHHISAKILAFKFVEEEAKDQINSQKNEVTDNEEIKSWIMCLFQGYYLDPKETGD